MFNSDNDFEIWTKGAPGNFIEVIFKIGTQNLVYKFPAENSEWTKYNLAQSVNGNTSLNIPNNISLIDVTINCSNYSSGEVKISGMKLAKSIPFIVLASKVFLQGPFIPASDPPAMTTALNSGGFIQTSQPYSASPWNYAGTEEVSPSFFTNNPSIADWILVELRTSIAPSPSDPRRAAFLKSDGNMVGLDGTSPVNFNGISPGDYYIVIRHRNHLAVMSSITWSLNSSSASVYDFTTDSLKFYGHVLGSIKLESGVWGMIGGDTNGSGFINVLDFIEPDNDRFLSGYRNSDDNMTGFVNVLDFILPDNNRSKGSQLP